MLRDWQQQCLRAVLFGETAELESSLSGGRIPAAMRVRVYRNNCEATFRTALASSYPRVERLVGANRFRGLAAAYLRRHPSRCGDLQLFGAHFPQFLAERCAPEFGYLADVARLEWAVEEALLEPACVPFDATALGDIDPADHEHLVFEVAASLRLVRSCYPIFSIWRATHPGHAPFDEHGGREYVGVVRATDGVELRRLEPSAFRLAQALCAGERLGRAIECLDSPGALGSALRTLVAAGYFSGFALSKASQ